MTVSYTIVYIRNFTVYCS